MDGGPADAAPARSTEGVAHWSSDSDRGGECDAVNDATSVGSTAE